MTETKNNKPISPRYRARLVGTKWDYVRRYKVVDLTTGRRVDTMPGGLTECDARNEICYLTRQAGLVCSCDYCLEDARVDDES